MSRVADTAQAKAAPAEVTLGGRAYRLSPLSDADLGELDNWVRARTIRAAHEAARGLPEPEAQALLRRAFAFAATQTWFGMLGQDRSIEMLARFFWQLVKRRHPDASLEAVRRAIAADPEALADALDGFDARHVTGDAEAGVTTDGGLCQFSRREDRDHESADGRRENGTVPFAAADRPVLTFPTERDYREWHDRGT